ncbi:MAG: family 20 glycosylhydrolase [Bacteroidia bacterium]|nr:family 20 glycosylhydrolase [Bacteroidia bacterium]
MNKILLLLSLIGLSLFSCDQTTEFLDQSLEVSLIPKPKQLKMGEKSLMLTESSKIYAPNSTIEGLAEVFSKELEKLTGVSMETTSSMGSEADIVFGIKPGLSKESYQIEISDVVEVRGGSEAALAMAKSSLLQLVQEQEGRLIFPILSIYDQPDANFRGLMIDLARKWHSSKSVLKLIDLAAFYKIKYLHLHFTDHQSFTFPSREYPKLPTPDRHYSLEELESWEKYSQARGVTIIPELEVPGHAMQFVTQYPEIFALEDTAENKWIINMGNEEAYEAISRISQEMMDVFRASSYFHIGGDEAYFHKVMDDPKVQAYVEKRGIKPDVHELYRHFLIQMNEMIKGFGKQMCVWEGFGPEGEVEIPKDILVFEFETNRYLPDQLIKDGYTVVNTSWKPLYVVNQRKWSAETIYGWNMWRWENWWDKAPSFEPIQLEKTPLIIGAEMCAWEQPEEAEIPSLRRRVPAFVERIWNTKGNLSSEELLKLIEANDQRLSLLIGDDRQEKP